MIKIRQLITGFLLLACWASGVPLWGQTAAYGVFDDTGGGGLAVYNSIICNNDATGNNVVTTATNATVTGGNLTDTNPKFVSQTDYHVLDNAPVYNIGDNTQISLAYDLQGYARVFAGTVDAGAYEARLVPVTYGTAENGTFTVTKNGTAVSSGDLINLSSTLTITATPNTGFAALYIKANGTTIGNPGTITISDTTAITMLFGSVSAVLQDNEQTLSLRNSIVYNNIVTGANAGTTISNLMDTNPAFISQTDFRTLSTSTAMDAGDSTVNNLKVDLLGNPRTLDSIINIGAYESAYRTVTFEAAPTGGSLTVRNGSADMTPGVSLYYGTPLAVTASALSGYSFATLTVNGSGFINRESFNLYINTTIATTFSAPTAAMQEAGSTMELYNNVLYNNIYSGSNAATNVGNLLSGDPKFATLTDYHLLDNSPVYNIGDNAQMTMACDIEGRKRVFAGTVDAGAYEATLVPVLSSSTGSGSFLVNKGTTTVASGEMINLGTLLYITATPTAGHATLSLKSNGERVVNPGYITVSDSIDITILFGARSAVLQDDDKQTISLYNSIVCNNVDSAANVTTTGGNLLDINPKFATQTDYHLLDNSPVYNIGDNTQMTMAYDLQGFARVFAGTIDAGAYEARLVPVTYGTASNGTFTVTKSGATVTSGDLINLGSVLTITATPGTGYAALYIKANGATIGSPGNVTIADTTAISMLFGSYCAVVQDDAKELSLYNTILYNNIYAGSNAGATGNNLMDTIPNFISQTDFRILHSSKAMDTGDSTKITLPADLMGYPRTLDSCINIGAYESAYRTVTFVAAPTGGTLTVKDASTSLTSGVSLYYGTSLIPTASALNGYSFATLTVNSTNFNNMGTFRLYDNTTVDAGFSAPTAAMQEAGSGMSLYNNILYNNVYAGSNATTTGGNLLDINPKFATQTDYHLLDNSPVYNIGENTQMSMAYDLQGFARVFAGTVDAGAYEARLVPVTYGTASNGTFTVTKNGATVTSGDLINLGSVLTATAIPGTGYAVLYVKANGATVGNPGTVSISDTTDIALLFGIISAVLQDDEQTLSLYNNILYNNVAAGSNAGTVSNNLLDINPLFTTQTDYKLQNTSTATNTGKNSVLNWLYDLAGNVRKQGSIVDLGAYESAVALGTATWNGTGVWNTAANWLGGTVPASMVNILIAGGTLSIDEDVSVADMDINAGAAVTLSSGKTLTVGGDMLIRSDTTGRAGTFVDYNEAGGLTVNGTTTAQQYLTGSLSGEGKRNGRYWYVASPVSGATKAAIDSASVNNAVWSYAEATQSYTTISGGTQALNAGYGYVVRLGSSGTALFKGTPGTAPNTGNCNIALNRTGTTQSQRGFTLAGNPYPSYIDWDRAVTGFSEETNISPNIWFRSQGGSSTMVFDVYNGRTGLGTDLSGHGTMQYIPPMQAFWVCKDMDDSGQENLTFTNSMRSHGSASLLRAARAQEIKVLRLRVSNGLNQDEAIVAFSAEASDGYDPCDAPKMTNGEPSVPEIYTLAEDRELTINSLNDENREVELPLGFRTGQGGEFTLRAPQISDFAEGTKVTLKDKLLGKTANLTDGLSYTFPSEVADTQDRFSIVFSSLATGIEENSGTVSVYTNTNRKIVVSISGFSAQKADITLYNTIGKAIYSATANQADNVLDKALEPGVYLVKVKIEEKQFIRKVTINQ